MKAILRRISASILRDLRVQYRARYLGTALVSLAVWAVALHFIRPASGFPMAPAFLFLNVYLMAFSLGMSQAACERRDGVIAALDLTPLRPHEFLAARCASLGLIAAVQTPLIALAAGKPIASWASLLAGIGAETGILSLAAFLIVAYAPDRRLTPARLGASLLFLVPPLLPFLGIQSGGWILVHPLQGPLVLFQGAFLPFPARTPAVAVPGSALWMAFFLVLCRAAFGRMRSGPIPALSSRKFPVLFARSETANSRKTSGAPG